VKILILTFASIASAQVMQQAIVTTKAPSGTTPITLISSTKCQAGVDAGNGAGKSANWNTTGASLYVGCSTSNGGGNPGPVDTQSNSNSNAINSSADSLGNHASIWYAASPTTNAAVQVTCDPGPFQSLYMFAFANTKTSSPLDQTNSNTTGSATSITTGSITPTTDGQVVFACLTQNDNSGGVTFSINASFNTPVQSPNNGTTADGGAGSYKVQTTAAAVNPTWSWSVAAVAAAAIASFKAP